MIESFHGTCRLSFLFSLLTNRSGKYLSLMEHDIMEYNVKTDCTLSSASFGDPTLKYKYKGFKIIQLLVY
jgi:hypothetical protein